MSPRVPVHVYVAVDGAAGVARVMIPKAELSAAMLARGLAVGLGVRHLAHSAATLLMASHPRWGEATIAVSEIFYTAQ